MTTIELLVIACRRRPAIVVPQLQAIPHRVHWTEDYNLPEGWTVNPRFASYVRNHVGHLRCFRGHADALKTMQADAALVLEDDALPNRGDWVQVVANAAQHLDRFELISLHGRAFHPDAFTSEELPLGVQLLTPKGDPKVTQRWVQGSLAYLIRKDAAHIIIDKEYDGYPIDIFICNEFKFGLVTPSPFNHGSQVVRSLID